MQTTMTISFREAAKRLGEQITTAEMAKSLRVSPSTVRQARLEEGASGHRNPPEGWAPNLARIAREREEHFRELAEALEADSE